MSTLRDLAADPFTSPYNIQALMPSLASAQDAARAYAAFPQTQLVLTLNSFVPAQQDGKLAALRDAASLLGPTLALPDRLPKVTPASLRLSTQALAAALATLSEQSEPGDALRAIGQDALGGRGARLHWSLQRVPERLRIDALRFPKGPAEVASAGECHGRGDDLDRQVRHPEPLRSEAKPNTLHEFDRGLTA